MEFRHFQTYRLPRPKRWEPLFTQDGPQDRRERVSARALPRRGPRALTSWLPLTQGAIPGMSAFRGRPRSPRVFRGRVLWFDPTQAQVVAPPVWVPEIRRRLRYGLIARRGRYLWITDTDYDVEAQIPRARVRPWTPRRGRYLSFVPDQVIIPPGQWLPEIRHRTRLVLFIRRGHFVDPPWPQATPPPPPAWVPEPRRRARFLPLARRGHTWTRVDAAPLAPQQARPRSRAPLRVPRQRGAQTPWPQVVVPPPVYPTDRVWSRARWRFVRKRGVYTFRLPDQFRAPDRPGSKARWRTIRKRGSLWEGWRVGAQFGPAPQWLEGGSESTGGEGTSLTLAQDAGAKSIGAEGFSTGSYFEGTAKSDE